jgi:hypothetical protein
VLSKGVGGGDPRFWPKNAHFEKIAQKRPFLPRVSVGATHAAPAPVACEEGPFSCFIWASTAGGAGGLSGIATVRRAAVENRRLNRHAKMPR